MAQISVSLGLSQTPVCTARPWVDMAFMPVCIIYQSAASGDGQAEFTMTKVAYVFSFQTKCGITLRYAKYSNLSVPVVTS